MENDVLNLILNRLDEMKDDIKTVQDHVKTVQDDVKTVQKNVKGLRDDVDTVYTLQQDDHKILLKNTDLLNIHTERLNTLISIANNNQYEHNDFDKRISKLELLIS